MSFLDPYDLSNAPGANTPPLNPPPEKSLNEEVTQVMGQLGSWWGGFKKQSQTALDTGRKGFADVVVSAQKELGKLAAEQAPSSSAQPAGADAQRSATQAADLTSDSSTPTAESPFDLPEPSSESSSSSPSSQPAAPASGYWMQGLLTRLQSTIPPNVVNAVQNSLPESVRHAAAEGVDFAQLRTTMAAEFQRVQGVTRAQAEEYVHKSEAFLWEAVKEAQEVLKDAVKVIPPEQQTASSSTSMIWDGSDVWMIPTSAPAPSTSSVSEDSKVRGGEGSTSALDSQMAVATRAESLLKTLKQNPDIIAHDPEADEVVKKLYLEWIEEETRDKGKVDETFWNEKGKAALKDDSDSQALQSTHDQLVPSRMADELFWQRYFFRVNQIERDEQKRKDLLKGSFDTDEDITWEDEEDEEDDEKTIGGKAKPTQPKQASTEQAERKVDTPAAGTPSTSTRASSDGSYDVVSSANSASGEPKPVKQPTGRDDSDSDGDSDWE